MHSCVFLNLQSCSEQPLQHLQKKKKRILKKNMKQKNKISLFFYACHCRRTCGHGSLYRVITIRRNHCPFRFVSSNDHPRSIRHPSTSVCLVPFVRPFPSIDVRPLPFIPMDAPYFSNLMLCQNFVASALYCYKILGHGITPCPRMMRALPLNQSQGISYKITHNHLSRFL